ncbi:hypothetical protein FSP39_010178 [Pinctada imbricata]|uniref:EGF-like domain-containing protein n=1 Tax=Pinctada imbricata TaxID=66713 RepID=A0AA88YC56_PINIB|nr:hypothetical protein FSP39_010178 [Pinctada imbricata]
MWILIHHIMMLLSVIMYTILYIPYLICSVRASGQFWIRLISYQNSDGTGSNGHPCDGKFFVRVGSCDHRFLVCVDDSFNMKTEVKVFCNVYFHGDYCDVFCVPRDDDSNGHYECDPITGQKLCLQGETCNQAIERCRPSPCLNGGTCINMEGTFRCNCPSGFIGSTCSERTEKCNFHGEVSCQNNGTCFKKNGVPVCACTSGWTGRYCEVDLDECKNYPCENNALCINTRGNFYCKCSNGFTGRTCDKITSCSQCFGASKCLFSKKENSLVCVCSKGYTGILCNEKGATNCISSKCRNNGTCLVRGDQYTCECPPEWTGETCEHEILGLKEECSGGNCDDHCNNPNGNNLHADKTYL